MGRLSWTMCFLGALSTPPLSAIAGSYKILHTFSGNDGAYPVASLTVYGGLLYGTTTEGDNASGVVFSISADGSYNLLHSFSGADGSLPASPLIPLSGALYGTTESGGAGCGTVYSITTTGIEKLLYSFPEFSGTGGNANTGCLPAGSLTSVKGSLVGTTIYTNVPGIYQDYGTIFQFELTGTTKVLHTFPSSLPDGANPYGGLIKANGILYGTTDSSILMENPLYTGNGTIYSLDPFTGAEKTIYAFQGGADGSFPQSSLIVSGKLLYGTTTDTQSCCGTLFSFGISTGSKTTLYSFKGGADGRTPLSGLVKINGSFYGTTFYGGGTACFSGDGCGTVFKVTKAGAETVLHRFKGGTDGANPYAGLVYLAGMLYGVTEYGGAKGCSPLGCGTIFAVKP